MPEAADRTAAARRGVALITGGAGFLGRHLAARLAADGRPARLLDPVPGPAWQAERLTGSVLDDAALGAALRDVDTVYHLAALSRPGIASEARYRRINAEGTRKVIDAAARHGVRRIVAVSTEAVLRDWRVPQAAPLTEHSPRPEIHGMPGPYARSKRAAEQIALEAAERGVPVCIVYPSALIGPGDPGATAPVRMVLDMLNRPPPAILDRRLNFVAVEDVARGIVAAGDRGQPGGRYFLTGEDVPLADLLRHLATLSGRAMPRRRIAWRVAAAAGALAGWQARLTGRAPLACLESVRLARHDWALDPVAARRTLGWSPGAIDAALGRTVDWLTAQGLVRPR